MENKDFPFSVYASTFEYFDNFIQFRTGLRIKTVAGKFFSPPISPYTLKISSQFRFRFTCANNSVIAVMLFESLESDRKIIGKWTISFCQGLLPVKTSYQYDLFNGNSTTFHLQFNNWTRRNMSVANIDGVSTHRSTMTFSAERDYLQRPIIKCKM